MSGDVNLKIEPIQVFEDENCEGDFLVKLGPDNTELDEDQHDRLLNYLQKRLQIGNHVRTPRIQRFAVIDQMLSTWQKLSPEDTKRENREESTGRQQALPVNLPLARAHVEDGAAFFSEIFAPVGGSFFANPGKRKTIKEVDLLTKKMEQDMKQSAYYSGVVSTMMALCKYNFGGFRLRWKKKARLNQTDGNVLDPIDVYNLLYDPSIKDVSKLYKEGEWVAFAEVRNRLWLIRNAEDEGLQNLDLVFKGERFKGQKNSTYEYGKATYYKNPPSQTRMNVDGRDSKTTEGHESDGMVDWASYGLGLADDKMDQIEGYEIVTMYAWINPEQFDLDRESDDSLVELWEFKICDNNWIIGARPIPGGSELPVYLSRMQQDEMNEALRTLAEHVRPFQRFVSFLVNTHIEGIRKNVYGLTVYDPNMIDGNSLIPGETSGKIPMKKTGDARLALQRFDSKPDTFTNLQTAGEALNLMKQFFPNQALPSQVAGIDRATNNQVMAVLQGAMRRMHMIVRSIDSMLMLPIRMAMYTNIATFDPDKSQLTSLEPEQVAELLSGGLGQINREAAAEQIRTIIFAIIQNPESASLYDVPGLLELWSILMNIGTDLSEFAKQAAPNPAGTVPSPEGQDPNAAATAALQSQMGG